MKKLPYRTVFLGTPEFATPILFALAENTEIVLAVSQPDRPSGRGCKLAKPPVKIAAETLGIEVIQPAVAKGKRFAERIAAYRPDFIVTAAYGNLLGKSVLEVPAKCSLNVHASLLPRYRGAAPAARAVLNGDREAGISIMQMELELDAGPVFHQIKTPIGADETAGELLSRLSLMGAEALLHVLAHFDDLTPIPQESDAATHAPMLTKQEGEMDWSQDAAYLHRHVRGMSPWPTAYTYLGDEMIKVHSACIRAGIAENASQSQGEVLAVSKDGIDVAAGGGGILRLTELQAASKKRMPVSSFIQGNAVQPGMVFGKAVAAPGKH
jgi:methionyl-tRNA formyltransferase